MQRRVQPELLDSLPADDPEAIRSRRELRLINAIMGNHRWLGREIRRQLRPGWRLLELGAGDGSLGARLAGRGVCAASQLAGLDLAPRPVCWPAGATWTRGDVLAEPLPDAEVVVANLFLHHFDSVALARLGARLPDSCRVLIASEPSRRQLHLAQAGLLALLALLGRVTRHDMMVSIRAGFRGGELAAALGIGTWECAIGSSVLGAHRLCAVRP